jgi:hypothetical protein
METPMSWEWEYKSNPQRWTLSLGEWRAVVQRLAGPRYLWRATIEHASDPSKRYEGPIDKDPMVGRTWCLTKIAELRTQK